MSNYLNSFHLNDHHALVTGAGRGLGEACALALAEAGAEITLVARSSDQLESWQNRSVIQEAKLLSILRI